MLTHAGQRAFYPLSPAHILSMRAAGYARQCGAKEARGPRQRMPRIQNTGKVAALQKNL